MNKQLEELAQPVAWPNGCNHSAIAALRYLAEKPRPAYGNSPYNTEHLYMIAGELKRMASQPLYSQEYVNALQQRVAELERYVKDRDAENEGLAMTVGKLRSKLATPVRLRPGSIWNSNPYNHGANDKYQECAAAVRAAGFKVEGEA